MDMATAHRSPSAVSPSVVSLAAVTGMMRRRMSRRLAREDWVARAGLRPPAMAVMMLIDELGPVSQKQVSDRLHVDPSDLVAMFDLLEEADFISRARDPRDRRRYAVSLTREGRARLRRFQALAAEVEDEVFGCLAADERDQLCQLLQRVVDHHHGEEDDAGGA